MKLPFLHILYLKSEGKDVLVLEYLILRRFAGLIYNKKKSIIIPIVFGFMGGN